MSHPCPVTSIKYCVNVSNKIDFARYQRTEKVKYKIYDHAEIGPAIYMSAVLPHV